MRQVAKYGSPLIVLLGLAIFRQNISSYLLPVSFDIIALGSLYLLCPPLRVKDGTAAILLFWLAPIALLWLLSERREWRDINSISIGIEVFLAGTGTSLLMFNHLKKHDARLIGAIVLTWAVAYLSGSTGGADRMVPWFNFLGLSVEQLDHLIVVIRKTIHVSFYGLLTWLIATYLWNQIQNRRTLFAYAFAFPLVVAIADEYRQSMMPNRGGSVSDVFLDMSATTFVLLILARRGSKSAL